MSARRTKAPYPPTPLIGALLVANFVSIMLLFIRVSSAGIWRYGFLLWNLMLAWLPLLFAWQLAQRLPKTTWRQPVNVLLTLVWLGFLPNSFYLVSDLIHLHPTGEVSLLFDAALFFSFIFNGYVAGFMSLYIIHTELLKRLQRLRAHLVIAGVLFLSGFAIYLGRNLRWNTWDVVFNPAGILFDVSERLINPISHPQAFTTTMLFFLILGSMYMVIWQFVRALAPKKR